MRSYNMKFDKQMHKKIWNQTVSFKKTTLQMKEKKTKCIDEMKILK